MMGKKGGKKGKDVEGTTKEGKEGQEKEWGGRKDSLGIPQAFPRDSPRDSQGFHQESLGIP